MLAHNIAPLPTRRQSPSIPCRTADVRSVVPCSFEDQVARAAVRKFGAKELVYCEGDPRTFVFQLEKGVIMLFRILPDGRRQVIDFAYPGDYIGLGVSRTHAFSAETTGTASVRCIQASSLDEAARRNPEIALSLYRSVSAELSSARSLLAAIGQRSAIERVATFLLSLRRRLSQHCVVENDTMVELPMRRADIADLLGLTIETVSRTITRLRMLHLIEVSHGTEIRIRDLQGLEALAGI